MKSTKGHFISRPELQQQLLALRDILLSLSGAADGDTSTPGEARDAVFKSVFVLRQFFGGIDGFQDAIRPLDVLIKASVDLDRGHLPALFKPRKLKGAPRGKLASDTIRVFVLVAVDLYVATGMTVEAALKRVVSEYSRAGVKMVSASAIRDWRSRCTDQQPDDRWMVISARVRELRAKTNGQGTVLVAQNFIRATAKILARS